MHAYLHLYVFLYIMHVFVYSHNYILCLYIHNWDYYCYAAVSPNMGKDTF